MHNFFQLIQLKLLAQYSFNAIYAYPAQFCILVKNHIRLNLQPQKQGSNCSYVIRMNKIKITLISVREIYENTLKNL
jgi:hypothetical protein